MSEPEEEDFAAMFEASVQAKHVQRGQAIEGTVVSIRSEVALVNIGGKGEALIDIDELKDDDGALEVAVGDRIQATVVSTEGGITLSRPRQRRAVTRRRPPAGQALPAEDPRVALWSRVQSTYEVGQVRTGKITRLAEFGAFVELEAGLEGLAHASTFAPTGRPGGWAKSISIGMVAPFEILSIDLEKKRIGLALTQEGAARAGGTASAQAAIVQGARLTGKVERHERFGVFVFLAPGRSGLMPFSETGLTREADFAKAFPIGSDVEVIVLEADPSGRRIRVSKKAVQDAAEAEELREYKSRADADSSGSLGSLADKLRDALTPKQDDHDE